MKKIVLLIKILLFAIGINLQSQQHVFDWARNMGGNSGDYSSSIVVDKFGNIYTTGYFFGTADFNPGPGINNLVSNGASDIFIQKLDAAGNFLWAKSLGGNSYDYGNSVAVDNSGNVYLTGVFQNTVDFDPGFGTVNRTSNGVGDIFVLKFDNSGNYVWSKQFGGVLDDRGKMIKIDSSNNIYTTGFFQDVVDFDPGTGIQNLSSAGDIDIFIQKLDSSGNLVWTKRMGSSQQDYGQAISLDNSGYIYTTGLFRGTVDFDPGIGISYLYSLTTFGTYIQKLDFSGNLIWAKQISGASWVQSESIFVDAFGEVYTTGYFIGTIDFDPGNGVSNFTSNGGRDIFILKLNSAGNIVWMKQIGGVMEDVGYLSL